MATYEYDGVTLTVGGNEVIPLGGMLALDARGQAVLAYRARGTVALGTSGSLFAESAIRAALLGDIPSSAGDAALSAAWERARGTEDPLYRVRTIGEPRAADAIGAADDPVTALQRAIDALSGQQIMIIPSWDAAVRMVGTDRSELGRMARAEHANRLCAAIDAAARKTPITAAEISARIARRWDDPRAARLPLP